MTRDELVRMGRFASLVVIGRPGADDENISPETVKAAIYDCARPVVIAPPDLKRGRSPPSSSPGTAAPRPRAPSARRCPSSKRRPRSP